jgi:drug/metabolite transporter (DMT)-like permease
VDAFVLMDRLYLIIPLFSACLYALAALCIKRSIELGMGPWRMAFLSNLLMFLVFGSMLFFNGGQGSFTPWWPPVLGGGLFFIGQVFTFLSLTKGDVSIATPVLGSKVILVAFFLVVFVGDSIGLSVWVAAFLALLGIVLLQSGSAQEQRGKTFRTVVLALISAAAFALSDVVMKKWCPGIGFARYVPVSAGTTILLSVFLIPFFNAPLWRLPVGSGRMVLGGLFLLSLQALGVAISIGIFADAAGTNIVYASRGLWSVLLVWWIGHRFSNVERHEGRTVILSRVVGATLILSAVILIFV